MNFITKAVFGGVWIFFLDFFFFFFFWLYFSVGAGPFRNLIWTCVFVSCIFQWGRQALLGIWFETVYLGVVFFCFFFSSESCSFPVSGHCCSCDYFPVGWGQGIYVRNLLILLKCLSIAYCPEVRKSVWLALCPPRTPPIPPSKKMEIWVSHFHVLKKLITDSLLTEPDLEQTNIIITCTV